MTVRPNSVSLGGLKTHYVEMGDPRAPRMVLLHDGAWGGAGLVSWGRALEQLAPEHHVVIPDLLGFGQSDKAVYLDRAPHDPRVHQVLGLLAGLPEPERGADIIGTSFGGTVALRLAVAAAGTDLEPRSVVSIGGSGGGPWKTEAMVREMPRWDGSREDLRRIVRLLVEDEAVVEDHLDERLASAQAPGHYRALAAPGIPLPEALRTPIVDPWPNQLIEVTAPVLIVAGTRDRLLNPEWATELARATPRAEIAHLATGHSPNLERPAELAAVVGSFLASVPRRRRSASFGVPR